MEFRTLRHYLLLALLLLAFFPLAGCGGGGGGTDDDGNGGGNGGGDDNGGNTATLVGIWRNTTIGAQGQTASCPGQVTVNGQIIRQCGENDTIQFLADGTWIGRGETAGTLLQPQRHAGAEHLHRVRGTWSLQGTNFGFFITDSASDDNGNNVFDAEEVVAVSPPVQVTIQVSFTASNRFTMQYTQPATGAVHTDTFQKLE